ncbi:uncharacterized protein LOC132798799 [Drosophila nasuta]|uniref:Uncharacterized protein LOC127564980 n=1 Tax=Drosophila albomicans TaxID=7291 RepID=A0A9C6SLE8_DROAB|nr:uncharacterized protein LOC127564980 [Drosophila albomicans]XP_060666765.1 uncharacterized protein LOC132798799 [Drosophila nasuta]
MCGGWACASFELACNNPPLSTLRYSGRDFIPTPCGPQDKCFVKDTSCSRGHCLVPHQVAVNMNPCFQFPLPPADPSKSAAVSNWKSAYEKLLHCNPK